jgi:hypothetical protein
MHPRTLDEKLDGREGQRFCGRVRSIVLRTAEAREAMDIFAFDTKRFAARRKQMDISGTKVNGFDQFGYRFDQMLAIVEYDQ